MKNQVELLSSYEQELLRQDMGVMALAIRYTSIALPVMFILTVLCWYFDAHSVLKFITTGTTLLVLIGWIGSFLQTSNLRKDIAANTKCVRQYILKKRSIEAYQTRSGDNMNAQKIIMPVILSDDEIQNAVNYKKSRIGISFPLLNQSAHYESILRYNYRLKVTELDGAAVEDFIVPIECYVKVKEGKSVTLSFARYSRKVFDAVNPDSVN